MLGPPDITPPQLPPDCPSRLGRCSASRPRWRSLRSASVLEGILVWALRHASICSKSGGLSRAWTATSRSWSPDAPTFRTAVLHARGCNEA